MVAEEKAAAVEVENEWITAPKTKEVKAAAVKAKVKGVEAEEKKVYSGGRRRKLRRWRRRR